MKLCKEIDEEVLKKKLTYKSWKRTVNCKEIRGQIQCNKSNRSGYCCSLICGPISRNSFGWNSEIWRPHKIFWLCVCVNFILLRILVLFLNETHVDLRSTNSHFREDLFMLPSTQLQRVFWMKLGDSFKCLEEANRFNWFVSNFVD